MSKPLLRDGNAEWARMKQDWQRIVREANARLSEAELLNIAMTGMFSLYTEAVGELVADGRITADTAAFIIEHVAERLLRVQWDNVGGALQGFSEQYQAYLVRHAHLLDRED